MSQQEANVAQLRLPSIAPLRNVILVRRVLDHLVKRHAGLPGMAVVYGDAGLGKTMACASASVAFGAVYIQVRSHFTKKSFLLALLSEMAIKPERTVSEMVNQICEQLVLSRRPLIIDEGDYLVSRGLIELVRDIYEISGAPTLLVGEERFPMNLKRVSERFYDRILEWQPAEKCDTDDAIKLAKLYSPDVDIKPELLGDLLKASRGVARRLAVNIENVRQAAKKAGKKTIGPDDFDPKGYYTGEAPMRRAA